MPGCQSQCPCLPPSPPQQPLRCFPPGLVLDKLESRAFAKKLQTVQKHHKDRDTSFDSVTVIRSQSHLSQKQQFFGACGAEPVCCSRGGHCCGAPRKHRAAPNGLPDGELQTRRPSGRMWARLAPSVIRALGLRDASGRLSEPRGPELLTSSAPRSLARSARFRKQTNPSVCTTTRSHCHAPRPRAARGRDGLRQLGSVAVPPPHPHAPRCLSEGCPSRGREVTL